MHDKGCFFSIRAFKPPIQFPGRFRFTCTDAGSVASHDELYLVTGLLAIRQKPRLLSVAVVASVFRTPNRRSWEEQLRFHCRRATDQSLCCIHWSSVSSTEGVSQKSKRGQVLGSGEPADVGSGQLDGKRWSIPLSDYRSVFQTGALSTRSKHVPNLMAYNPPGAFCYALANHSRWPFKTLDPCIPIIIRWAKLSFGFSRQFMLTNCLTHYRQVQLPSCVLGHRNSSCPRAPNWRRYELTTTHSIVA
jgi:hypothetical protein